jgi:hypothetical protein
LKFHQHHDDGDTGAYRHNISSPRNGSSSMEPPYLELQGSADDNEIPYEKVFEMEQKKRRLFAASGQGGGSSSHLAQVH